MSNILLVISTICFIAAFGIHIQGEGDDWCPYMEIPLINTIPWISGFILAVIPESFLFDISWVWLFFINIPIVYILGPFFTGFVLRRIKSGKGAGVDVIISIIIAIVTMTFGIILV